MNKKTKFAGLTKLPTGIAGFDQLTAGGLPAERASLLLGPSGTGKTVFALQTLVHGAQTGHPGVFVSFNEPPHLLVENGAAFGWDLADLEQEKLVFLDARTRPSLFKGGPFALAGMLAGLQAVATELGAKRIVFDSLNILLSLLNDPQAELQELFHLRDWLLDHGFTALFTAGFNPAEPQALRRQELLQSLADCVVGLDCRSAAHGSIRSLRVVKYRGSACPDQEAPFRIRAQGIEVALPAGDQPVGPHPEIEQARKELTAKVQAMDRFLEMKQAELNFLLDKQAGRPQRDPAPSSRPGVASPRRGARSPKPEPRRPRHLPE